MVAVLREETVAVTESIVADAPRRVKALLSLRFADADQLQRMER
jgi:hypothetical protein